MNFRTIKAKYFKNPSWACGVACGLALLVVPFVGEKIADVALPVRNKIGSILPQGK